MFRRRHCLLVLGLLSGHFLGLPSSRSYKEEPASAVDSGQGVWCSRRGANRVGRCLEVWQNQPVGEGMKPGVRGADGGKIAGQGKEVGGRVSQAWMTRRTREASEGFGGQ